METTTTTTRNHEILATMLGQIGPGTLLAVSGGRFIHDTAALRVSLPIRYGYSVEVTYNAGPDLYTVERIFTRGLKRSVKFHTDHVYGEDLAEIVYTASCWNA